MTIYLHETPGRLRVTVPTLKAKPHRCVELERTLSECDGIDTVQVKPLTGSVVIYFDPERTCGEKLLECLIRLGHLDETVSILPQPDVLGQGAVKTGEALGRAVIGWAMGKALEANGLSLLAALI